MIRRAFLLFPIIIFYFFLIGCKPENVATPAPTDPVLSYPDQNLACTTGTILSNTESTVTFTWNASANTESYELHVKNLLLGLESLQSTNTNQLSKTLLRNTPYSWYVVSKSSKTTETAQSATWKFYNSGTAVVTHPPFPAEIISPTFEQEISANSTITLTWSGSDVDNDIAGYDVYLGTTRTPPLFKSNVTTMSVANVSVISGNTYFWKVVSKDLSGNTAQSDLFQFKAN